MKHSKFLLFILLFSFISCKSTDFETTQPNSSEWKTNYPYVFVHGIAGWGQYEFKNHFYHYFGCSSGSLVKKLRKNGITAYEASVDPQGSAWDRACELYAQLTGTVVDYGIEHSTRCGHERFGKDYSKKPLVSVWDEENKLNFIGHSFGGITIRLLSELLENGSTEEMAVTSADEISPLFTGGHSDLIYSITTYATPHNGTTGYHIKHPEPKDQTFYEKSLNKGSYPNPKDNRADYDYASYDMKVPQSEIFNQKVQTLPYIYYFSFAGCATSLQPEGFHSPNPAITEKLVFSTGTRIGKFEGISEDGIEFGKEWQPNDGLVNTISALAPFNAPQTEYVNTDGEIQKGIWYIMPVISGHHMFFQGGIQIKREDFFPTYYLQIDRINRL